MSESSRSSEDLYRTISIDKVHCREEHIRKTPFSVDTLKATIADAGLLQPILVCRAWDGSYEVIDGARRLAALRELGVQELIVGRDIVIDPEETEADVRFKQLIANVQREDLNDVELGQAFVTLKEEHGYRYNEIAEIIGRTPHYVAAKVGLIKRLDPQVRRRYLEDVRFQKCIQSTFFTEGTEAIKGASATCLQNNGNEMPGLPYVMNVNVLEDIARLPREVQPAAYREIRACRMDRDEAVIFLRMLKDASTNAASLTHDKLTVLAESARDEQAYHLRRRIARLARDLEALADCMKSDGPVDGDIIAEIESMIGRLSSLCNKMRAKETEGKDQLLMTPGTGLSGRGPELDESDI